LIEKRGGLGHDGAPGLLAFVHKDPPWAPVVRGKPDFPMRPTGPFRLP
jgi:hypothetical protein